MFCRFLLILFEIFSLKKSKSFNEYFPSPLNLSCFGANDAVIFKSEKLILFISSVINLSKIRFSISKLVFFILP